LLGLVNIGSYFGIISHILWLYNLEYNFMIFEYIIIREIESLITIRLTRRDEMTRIVSVGTASRVPRVTLALAC
jgi:hypothetical protein